MSKLRRHSQDLTTCRWQLELWDEGRGSRSGRSQSSQKQLSDLMACPVSLPSRKKGTIEMMNGCL